MRTDGGGFCGARTVAFDAPLDLSAYEGLFIDAVLESQRAPRRADSRPGRGVSRERGFVVGCVNRRKSGKKRGKERKKTGDDEPERRAWKLTSRSRVHL